MANKINITIVSVVAMLATPVSAQITDVTRADQWIVTHKAGYTYMMPPIECRVGPHPDFTISPVPQAELDAFLPENARLIRQHLFAIHDRINDMAVIYISSALPHRPAIHQNVFQHELGHLRGCEHGPNPWKS